MEDLSLIKYTKGELVLYEATPLAKLLGYRNPHQAIRRNVPKSEQQIIGKKRYITEAGATFLIAKANKPKAEQFRSLIVESFSEAAKSTQEIEAAKNSTPEIEAAKNSTPEIEQLKSDLAVMKGKSLEELIEEDDVQKSIESIDKTLGDVIDDVPPDISHLYIPSGYSISNTGIFNLQAGKFALNSLVFISKITTEIDRIVSDGVKTQLANRDFFTLTMKKNNHWIHISATPEQILNAKNIVDVLAPFGINITTNHSKIAVSYFNNFKVKNEELIPHVDRYTKTGWHGEQFIIPREDVDYEIDAGESVNEIYQHGSREKSLDLINRGLKYTAVKVLVAASVAATFISKVNCRNFTINIQSKTETGKTAAMRLANSIWGSPEFMINLNATHNAVEFAATERNCLPLFANEFQVMNQKSREQFGDMIHRFELGKPKLRMNKSIRLNPTKNFHSIMCVTAEQPLAEDNVIGGVLTRVFEIPLDVAIGEFDSNTRQFKTNYDFCHEIYQSTDENGNFGFIGLEFVRRLEEDPSEFDRLKADFNENREQIFNEMHIDSLASHVDYVAVLSVGLERYLRWFSNLTAEDIANQINEFKFELASKLKSKEELSDVQRALKFVQDFYLENISCFIDAIEYVQAVSNESTRDDVKNPGRRESVRKPLHYYGFFNPTNQNSPTDNHIAFVPNVIKDALKNAGFSPAKILKEFADAGITDCNPNRIDKTMEDPITGKRSSFIVFKDLFNQPGGNNPQDGFPPEQSPF